MIDQATHRTKNAVKAGWPYAPLAMLAMLAFSPLPALAYTGPATGASVGATPVITVPPRHLSSIPPGTDTSYDSTLFSTGISGPQNSTFQIPITTSTGGTTGVDGPGGATCSHIGNVSNILGHWCAQTSWNQPAGTCGQLVTVCTWQAETTMPAGLTSALDQYAWYGTAPVGYAACSTIPSPGVAWCPGS